MNLDEFRAKTKKWNQFSAIDTLGAFDFYTSIISLDSLSAQDIGFVKMELAHLADIASCRLTGKQYFALAKVLPLAAHEYTHFVDSTSTLWGFQHLSLMNRAYLCDDRRGGSESEFHNAKAFHDHVRRIRLPEYYTTINKRAAETRPWRSQISIGRTFSGEGRSSTRPVLFSRFSNFSNEPLVRSPISTVSILEASAMAQEVLLHSKLLDSTDQDFKLVEQQTFSKTTAGYLYNKEITEYSVCVHVLANKISCDDISKAFSICALLTRLVLNISRESFQLLENRCPIADILEMPADHDFVVAIRDGLKACDLGTIYYLLCCALPSDVALSDLHMREGVAVAIGRLGTNLDAVMTSAGADAEFLIGTLRESPIEPIRQLAIAGHENFARLGFQSVSIDFHRIHTPPALLGDSTEFVMFGDEGNALASFDLDRCFDQLFAGQAWVDRFAEACL